MKHTGVITIMLTLTSLFASCDKGSATKTGPEDLTMNVLFIGNSLTADAVEHLPRIFKNMGITNVNLYAVYRGGHPCLWL